MNGQQRMPRPQGMPGMPQNNLPVQTGQPTPQRGPLMDWPDWLPRTPWADEQRAKYMGQGGAQPANTPPELQRLQDGIAAARSQSGSPMLGAGGVLGAMISGQTPDFEAILRNPRAAAGQFQPPNFEAIMRNPQALMNGVDQDAFRQMLSGALRDPRGFAANRAQFQPMMDKIQANAQSY